jgi:hypothetical protein
VKDDEAIFNIGDRDCSSYRLPKNLFGEQVSGRTGNDD